MTTIDSARYFANKWELWRSAREFTKLTQACNYVLEFVLGRNDMGFSYGNFERRYTGPKLDLTGATVELICEKMPVKPGLVDAARGEWWITTLAVFSVEGTVTDAVNGEVEFELDTDDTDTVGDCIAMVKVTDASDNVFVVGYLRLTFLEKLG